MKLQALVIAALVAGSINSAAAGDTPKRPPNVIVILADDMEYTIADNQEKVEKTARFRHE